MQCSTSRQIQCRQHLASTLGLFLVFLKPEGVSLLSHDDPFNDISPATLSCLLRFARRINRAEGCIVCRPRLPCMGLAASTPASATRSRPGWMGMQEWKQVFLEFDLSYTPARLFSHDSRLMASRIPRFCTQNKAWVITIKSKGSKEHLLSQRFSSCSL